MRTIIAGSRHIFSLREVEDAIYFSGFKVTLVLCGMASGIDLVGKSWAENNLIPVEEYPAEWERYGKGAGFKRNAKMAANADQLIAVWDEVSTGTKHMIDIATAMKLKVFIYPCK